MSWWCYIENDDGSTVGLSDKHNISGGTYAVGGTDQAELNVTYNYGYRIRQTLDPAGIHWLDGKKAGDTMAQLMAAADLLSGEPDADYWKATDGNIRKALLDLASLAALAPNGKWRIS